VGQTAGYRRAGDPWPHQQQQLEGVPVKTLLNEVGVQSSAAWALVVGWGNESVARSIPLDKLMDDALIAYGQNGEALRPEQGYLAHTRHRCNAGDGSVGDSRTRVERPWQDHQG
jgi:DMSO/TMAO reductase YedYZ molybdopterin-dependent catalytic subunit